MFSDAEVMRGSPLGISSPHIVHLAMTGNESASYSMTSSDLAVMMRVYAKFRALVNLWKLKLHHDPIKALQRSLRSHQGENHYSRSVPSLTIRAAAWFTSSRVAFFFVGQRSR
jgi:hypothetical protein